MSLAKTEGEGTIAEIMAAMVQKHLPYIAEAGKQGVQILCFQRNFQYALFLSRARQCLVCFSGNRAWPNYGTDADIRQKYNMVIIVPIYEKEQSGVFYNTAAVIDADGSYLGKYRKIIFRKWVVFGKNISSNRGIWAILFSKLSMLKSVFTFATTAIFLMEHDVWG